MEPALIGAVIIACCFAAGTFRDDQSKKRTGTPSRPSLLARLKDRRSDRR